MTIADPAEYQKRGQHSLGELLFTYADEELDHDPTPTSSFRNLIESVLSDQYGSSFILCDPNWKDCKLALNGTAASCEVKLGSARIRCIATPQSYT